jgi:hypothetical protein
LARDNFKPPVIDKLKARVAMRCSNPTCRVPTSAAATNVEKVNSIGVAAHICAASPGGPRYNKKMTPAERISIENAIWLCSNCSTEIDRDIEKYTTSKLNEWKKTAETTAKDELGQKLPSKTDTLDTLSTALTGYPKSFISTAISNIHSASGKALEILDPRFSIRTAYQNDTTFFSISAKEHVSLTLKANNEIKDEYIAKYTQLVKHGIDLEISSGAITIQGSKLFEEVFNQKNGVLSIASRKIPAIQKMSLVQDGTNIVESLDDIKGEIAFGTESFTFQGSACNDILKFKYQKSINNNNRTAKFNFELHFDQWENKDITSLPYFEKIMTFFSKVVAGWKLSTSLEINGERILSGEGVSINKEEFFLHNNSHLQFIRCGRVIAKHMQVQLKYKSSTSYSKNEFVKINEIASILEGKEIYQKKILSNNATCKIEILADNLSFIQELGNPTSIQFSENIGETVKLFDTTIKLPAKLMSLTNVLAKLKNGKEIAELKIGDVIDIEWIPQGNFQYSVTYKTQ